MINSLYIHIPFCKNICSYCDFCKMFYNEEKVLLYLDALKEEVIKYYKRDLLKTIYIGGVNPSSLSYDGLYKLFDIMSLLNIDKDYEFTFECNIEDIDLGLLKFLKKNKVNRLSIGIESFNKDILNILGRGYDFSIKEKIDLAKKYFNNINIDLMFGINGETIDILESDLEKFIELDVNHISIYSLILEEHTKLSINKYKEISDDISRNMYDKIVSFLEEHGYMQYEISNFSKKGFCSLHNLTYWNNEHYYGFGLSASGYISNIRYTNTSSLTNYLNSNYRKVCDTITKNIDMENEMMLGLRKVEGVNKRKFYNKFGVNIEDYFDVSLLNKNKDYFYIDKNNLYVSNYIISNFIDV